MFDNRVLLENDPAYAARLAALQRKDGSWCNERSGRWMESIPQLATAYSLMAIQYLK